jgi:hypothetical protein
MSSHSPFPSLAWRTEFSVQSRYCLDGTGSAGEQPVGSKQGGAVFISRPPFFFREPALNKKLTPLFNQPPGQTVPPGYPHTVEFTKNQKYDSIVERIGRLKERNKVGWLYEIKVTKENDRAVDLCFTRKKTEVDKFGEYVIRTSRTDLADHEISSLHRTLTRIEGSFRWMKQDLGLRPNYHQIDSRVEGHIFITVLAYFILAPILAALARSGSSIGHDPKNEKSSRPVSGKSESGSTDKAGTENAEVENAEEESEEVPTGWRSVVNAMATMVRVTTSFTCKDGRRMHIRTTCDPNPTQQAIFKKLGVKSHILKRVIYKEKS